MVVTEPIFANLTLVR